MEIIYFDQQECRAVHGHNGIFVPVTGEFVVSTRVIRKGHDGSVHKLIGAPDKDGYIVYSTCRSPTGTALRLHKAVALAWKGPSGLPLVRHLDDNKLNNHADNLAWGTDVENGMDKRKFGTAKGSRNSQAKMTAEFVAGLRAAAIHKPVGVLMRETTQFSKFAVWAAITGYTWAHLPGAIESKRRCTKQGWKDGIRLRT